MALNFPDSPVDGQIFESFYWDNAAGVWKTIVDDFDLGLAANFSNTATGTFTDGYDYKCVIFKTDGTLVVTRGGYADILVVGGGGAGGGGLYAGGGGGAGGFIYKQNVYLPVGSHSVTVGAGGVATTLNGSALDNDFAVHETHRGKSSSLLQYTAMGGGPGSSGYTGYPGASSGGGGYITIEANRISGVPGQGNSGGTAGGNSGSPYPGGGGGGAGAQGSSATSVNNPGNGGNGSVANIIPTSLATSESVGEVSGSDVYFAGGGAGGNRSGVSGTAGLGGGAVARADGSPNTGGGGGANSSNNANIAGDGGSGVVIVRVKTELGS